MPWEKAHSFSSPELCVYPTTHMGLFFKKKNSFFFLTNWHPLRIIWQDCEPPNKIRAKIEKTGRVLRPQSPNINCAGLGMMSGCPETLCPARSCMAGYTTSGDRQEAIRHSIRKGQLKKKKKKSTEVVQNSTQGPEGSCC